MTLTNALLVIVALGMAVLAGLHVLCWRTLLTLRSEREVDRDHAASWTKGVLSMLHWELAAALSDKRRPSEGALWTLTPWLVSRRLTEADNELLHRLHHLHNALKQYPDRVEEHTQAVVDQLERMLGYRAEVIPGITSVWVD